MPITRFTVRVYGLLLNEQQQLLVTDELFENQYLTKLPGGGVEFGEGTIDALHREFDEECACPIQILTHIYTTDFFIQSIFSPNTQVLCVYYRIQAPLHFVFLNKQLTTNLLPQIVFRWVDITTIHPHFFRLESDNRAVQALLQQI